jgi:hypothetical protein
MLTQDSSSAQKEECYCLSNVILISDFSANFLITPIASSPSGVGNNTLIAAREPFSWEISINIGLDQGLGFLVLYPLKYLIK